MTDRQGDTSGPGSQPSDLGNPVSIPIADLPPIDVDEDGYPEDAWLDALGAHTFTPQTAALFLVETFPAACKQIPCCRTEVLDAGDAGRPVKDISFVTGGWSGAEDLIGTMLSQFWIRHFHTKWERGGLFCFEVPCRLLPAQGTQAQGAETIGSACESPVRQDAPNPSQEPST